MQKSIPTSARWLVLYSLLSHLRSYGVSPINGRSTWHVRFCHTNQPGKQEGNPSNIRVLRVEGPAGRYEEEDAWPSWHKPKEHAQQHTKRRTHDFLGTSQKSTNNDIWRGGRMSFLAQVKRARLTTYKEEDAWLSWLKSKEHAQWHQHLTTASHAATTPSGSCQLLWSLLGE